jgi:hypothetical protein
MTTMVTELYDALLSAGAPEDKARAAAEVVANYDREFGEIKSDLRMVKWAQAATFAMTVAIFGKLFIH